LITFGDLYILLIIGYELAGLEICIITNFITQAFEVRLIGGPTLDAGGVLHGYAGEGDIFIDEWDIL
jgi:hypothetical protein